MDKMIDKNILKNMFTKCGNCKLRFVCDIHRDSSMKVEKDISEFVKTNKLRLKEKPNNIDWSNQLDQINKDYMKDKRSEFTGTIKILDCEYEKQDIVEDLKILQQKYPFDDARVYLTVKQYIRQSILDFRAFKEAANSDLVTYRYSEGGQIPTVNPLLNYKLASAGMITKLISDLDRYMKDDKLMDMIETNNSRLFTDYLSKIPSKVDVVKVIDIVTNEQ